LFCSYIYCEKADVTTSTAGPLMIAANKYLLTGLVSVFLEVLEKSISPDAVCTILQHTALFGEDKLKEKCLNFISNNAEVVFNSDAFVNISHEVLEIVVSLKALATTEKHVFESCVRWARCQLLESGNKDPSDEEIREKLGSVLYEIRFPTMTTKEFAGLTAHSKILTGDEKHDVYVYMTTKERLGSLKFVADSRNKIVIRRLTLRCDSLCNNDCREVNWRWLIRRRGGISSRRNSHTVTRQENFVPNEYEDDVRRK